MKKYTDKDVKDFADKLFDAANKACAGHLVQQENIDKNKEASFTRWVKNLLKMTKHS